MTPVRWAAARSEDLPRGEAWLSPAEQLALARLTVPKRRGDWLLGRFAARRVLLLSGAVAREEEVSVLASPSGAPEVHVAGLAAPFVLSITHSHGHAAAAIAPAGARLGLDLERIEPRSGSFLEDWFTASERAFVSAAPEEEASLRTTLVWSAKEAVMKALREGLRIAPRDVETAPVGGPADGLWRPFGARGPGSEEWSGWWRAEAGFVLASAADPPSDPPERIG
ncbi:MAG: 4'-phosphopantetheinyl transferase family protein [Thermoanaerobaculia bacterium]